MEPSLRSLSVLFLEDSEKDIEIVYQKLADDLGCPIHMDSARTEQGFSQLIRSKRYDLILAAYTLPGYNASAALRLCLEVCPETPFICVSGTIGEDTAVELLKQGATDYVLKDRLERLSFAILRALEVAETEREKKLAGMEISRVKEILKEAQRIAHIGSWDWDIAGGKLYWSDESYRLLGLEPSGEPVRTGLHLERMLPEDRKMVEEARERALKNHEPFDVTYRVNALDGKVKYIHSLGSAKYDEAGQPIYMSGTMQDITERKLAELEILRTKESLEEAQRIAHIGSWEWDLVKNEYHWSAELYRILGVDRQATPEGTAISYDFLSPDDERAFEAAARNAFESGVPYDVEIGIVRKDGEARHVRGIGVVQSDADGRPVFARGITQDITERKLAEMEINRAKENFEEAQRIAHLGSWEWNIKADKVFMSVETCRIMGLNPKEAEFHSSLPYEHMNDEDRRRVSDEMDTAVRGDKPYDVQFAISKPDGKTAIVHSYAHVERDADGTPVMMTGIMQDITERKLAEEKAARNTEFRHLAARMARDFINLPLDKLDDAIFEALDHISNYFSTDRTAIWRFDWTGELAIREYNWNRLPEMDAYIRHGEIRFADIPEVIANNRRQMPFFMKNISELSVDSRYREFAKSVGTKSILAIPLIASGEVFGTLTVVSFEKEKEYKDNEPEIINIFSQLISNVLKRKEREEALHAAYETNRHILDSISEGVALYDRKGTVLSMNGCFASRFGKTPQEMLGKNMRDYLPCGKNGDLHDIWFEILKGVFNTGVTAAFEDERGGRWYWNRFYPVLKDGTISAATLFTTDITDQKKAGDEARKRAETEARLTVMTEFFTNVSHELKTPLSLILMQIDMMRMHLGNEVRMRGLMDDATLNAYRLTRLVSNLLDITKVDAGFMKLNLKKRDIVNVLRNICNSVAGYAAAKSIVLDFTSDVPEKHMDVDRDKLDRIVLNLLSNAIKHTPEQGRIALELRDMKDKVLILVKDSGEGIPEDKLSSIFDRFVQVSNRMSRQAEGCGIGLALVKSMVELHGGKVWAESELGKGSLFAVELPAAISETGKTVDIIEGFELNKKVMMELSDLYIKADA